MSDKPGSVPDVAAWKMELTSEISGDALIVHVNVPRIDAAGASGFKDAMKDAIEPASNCVILDLGRVLFVDSSGLGAIISVMKTVIPARRFELAAPSPTVRRVLQLTRLDTMLTIHAQLPGTDGGMPG
jgi:anti-sigma B factor antagonist